MIYEFDGCVLDRTTQELRRDGELVHVEPQVLAVLELLVANRDRMVTKIELLDEVWGDRFVSESALTSRIKLARKACGDSGREQRIVKTVHGRGYRFVADVVERRPGRDAPPAPRAGQPSVTSGASARAVVGRESELMVMEELVDATRAGARRTAFVTGEPGAGKSTLIAEVVERADGSRAGTSPGAAACEPAAAASNPTSVSSTRSRSCRSSRRTPCATRSRGWHRPG